MNPLPVLLSIVVIAFAVSRVAAAGPCPRDPLYPVELPWIECPASVALPLCVACPTPSSGEVSLELVYPELPPALYAGLISGRLGAAKWTVDAVTPPPVNADRITLHGGAWRIEAHHGHDRATFVVDVDGSGSRVRLDFAPG